MIREVSITIIFLSFLTGALLGYNGYQQQKNRELEERKHEKALEVYKECLVLNEKALAAGKSTMFCSIK